MKPLRTREDILALAAQHAPSKACERAISENRAVVLGGFTVPECHPAYYVHVLSKHGREWLLQVNIDEEHQNYWVYQVVRVPWAYWDGKWGGKRLIDGDQ